MSKWVWVDGKFVKAEDVVQKPKTPRLRQVREERAPRRRKERPAPPVIVKLCSTCHWICYRGYHTFARESGYCAGFPDKTPVIVRADKDASECEGWKHRSSRKRKKDASVTHEVATFVNTFRWPNRRR